MINLHLIISGRVQGVGFRWSTVQLAQRMGLAGFVKSLINGDVYVEVQGPVKIVQIFVKRLQRGPTPYASVTKIKQKNGDLQDYQGRFTVRR